MSVPKVVELLAWATINGAHIHEKVEICDDNQYGISLKVRSTISHGSSEGGLQPTDTPRGLPQGSCVVSCPFELSLSYLNALDVFPDLKAHSPRFPELFFRDTEPQVIGHFFLMQQYLMAEGSYWGPYIKSLPQSHERDKLPTLLYFAEADMKWLRGTNLERAKDERERTWQRDWKRGCGVLDSYPEWNNWKGRWTWELYKWAATIFSSRSFVSNLIPREVFEYPTADELVKQETLSSPDAGNVMHDAQPHAPIRVLELSRPDQLHHVKGLHDGPFPVLFPVVDLANHSPAAEVTWFTNARNTPRDLSIIPETDIPEADQIFNNYGPKSNAELLLGYGFCIPDNDEVAIALKQPRGDITTLRLLHSCSQGSKAAKAGQKVFHIRRVPYPRPPSDKRLSEFAIFEDGCVDTLAVYVANQREKEFIAENPHYCPERYAAATFSTPLSRNTLNIMSVLYEKVSMALNEILENIDENLGIPKNSAQCAAKIYRQGQIQVLQATMKVLERRLDAAASVHSICGYTECFTGIPAIYHDMRVNVELITLPCAFSWLQAEKYSIWFEITIAGIRQLDAENADPIPHWRWYELIAGEWDSALWCLWIYIVTLCRVIDGNQPIGNNFLREWIDNMLIIYNPDGNFSAWPFQNFYGETDERETLEIIVSEASREGKLFELLNRNNAKIQNMGGLEVVNRKFMNLASAVTKEECFMVSTGLQHYYQEAPEQERINQRVLCLSKRNRFSEYSPCSIEGE